MFSWQKLFKTPTFWIETIQNDLFGHVEDYLAKTGKSKQDFANDLGVSKGYVSQILNGHFDHKLSKLVELYLSIGMVPIVIGANLNAYVSALSNGVSKNEFIREICTDDMPKKNKVKSESHLRQQQENYTLEIQVPDGSIPNALSVYSLGAMQYKPQIPSYDSWTGVQFNLPSIQQNTTFAHH
jgi:transcriptional regulator with XRE-family HTH domain